MNDLTITMGNLEEKRDDPALARDGTIADEYLRVLATQASRVPVPVFIAALIIASMAANHYAVLVWGSWLVIITTILLARWRILTGLPSKQEVSIDQRERIAVSLSLANGLAHGASLLFFPEFTLAERSIMTLILAGAVLSKTVAGHHDGSRYAKLFPDSPYGYSGGKQRRLGILRLVQVRLGTFRDQVPEVETECIGCLFEGLPDRGILTGKLTEHAD
jgi:hypothetical protein